MTTQEVVPTAVPQALSSAPTFIETQFPVSKLSKESYKERKAGSGQTLTGLGKWWGRKPLVVVRAAILGMLLPTSQDPQRDREVFLSLMTMDDEGLESRLRGAISPSVTFRHCTPSERGEYFDLDGKTATWKKAVAKADRVHLQALAFRRMSYDEKLKYCKRPEEVTGPSKTAWSRINAHLGTSCESIPQLIHELGRRRFGEIPKVSDPFCGGGSIPFEAARMGCVAYGSDLNPTAALLTYGALNIVGGGAEVASHLKDVRNEVRDAVQAKIDAWGIERNEDGWVAEAYLYCTEVLDPSTGWTVPLATSWVAAERPRVFVRLIPNSATRRFAFEVVQDATSEELEVARLEGTWRNGIASPVDSHGNWIPRELRAVTPLSEARGKGGAQRWEPRQLDSRDGVFRDRIYCIRWLDPATGERHYRAPTEEDEERERQVLDLLEARLDEWQSKGFVPSASIEPGQANMRPTNARGWTSWMHYFNPRQLLLNGAFAETAARFTGLDAVALVLLINRLADWNSRLCIWLTPKSGGLGGGNNTFYGPSINTPGAGYVARTMLSLESAFDLGTSGIDLAGHGTVDLRDARTVVEPAHLWLTDPGYGDTVPYAEFSEFFLAWSQSRIKELFPDWYTDSKRALSVEVAGDQFRRAMVECYRNFARLMPDEGLQLVMFTHQDAEVWSDLALILWASGLRVTAAWTVATETSTGSVKGDNFVQGTVLLVLRKRLTEKQGDMADIYPDLQEEVQRQMQSMLDLDPKDDPNFSDSDYQLAAYAAALRVLTEYSSIDEIDVERELFRERSKRERSPLTRLIERAVKIASDYLVPDGLERAVWKKLSAEERLYMKGLEIESHGEYRDGVYQEFARGFGVGEYRWMLGSTTANRTRLKTPSEFKGRDLGGKGFAGSLVRQLLYAIWITATHSELDPRPARAYLKQELPEYWDQRSTLMELLRYVAEKPRTAEPSRVDDQGAGELAPMAHWAKDCEAARLLAGSIENDSV